MDIGRVRADFPIYSSANADIIYLDNACQTLRPRQVIDSIVSYYEETPACGGRSVHRLASAVSAKVDEAREAVARFIGCGDPDCVVFTKNCTEALNTVARGLSLKRGDVVLTTDLEHNSNHVPWTELSGTVGIKRRQVATPPSGAFDLDAYLSALAPDVRLVSMVHTSNVNGASIPDAEVVKAAHDAGALVMLDGAQSVPHRRIDVEKLDVDFLAFSLHKMLGPSGMGALYGKKELLRELAPLTVGGGAVASADFDGASILPPPDRFEAGLQDYAGIIGSGAAVRYLEALGMDEVRDHEARLNALATEGLRAMPEVSILEPKDASSRSGVLPFNVSGMGAHDVALIIDEMAKVQLRSGMHCAHPYFKARGIDGCARASFYVYNSEEEVRRFLDAMGELVHAFSS